MFKKLHWMIVLVFLLSIPALACGPFGGEDAEATAVPVVAEPAEPAEPAAPVPEPTTPPPAAPKDTPVPEPVAEPTEETAVSELPPPALSADALSFAALSESPFDSYRFEMNLEFSGTRANGEPVNQNLNASFAFVKEPPASSMVMSFTGFEAGLGMEEIEMVQVEGTNYMVIPEMGCITTSGGDLLEENPFSGVLEPDQYLQDLENAKYEGEETINGIRTLHYSFDKLAMIDANPDDIDEAEGHIYIAKEEGFLVRMVMDATGNIDFLDEGVDQAGDLHIEVNLTDVNEPVDITIPADCETTTEDAANFPMLDDAYEISSFSGFLSYKSDLPLEEILAFYDGVLTADGWVKDESGSFVGDGVARVPYGRDGETMSVTISPDDANGGNYVVLLSDIEG